MASRSSRRVAWVLAALLSSAAPGAQAPAADQQRVDAAAQRAAERIRALRREADTLAAQEKTLLGELRGLEIERALKNEELTNVEREVRLTQDKLGATAARAAALRNVADTERPEVQARLVQLYKLGQAGYWRLLLDLDNVQSIGRAYRTASAMSHLDRERVRQHQRTIDALARERQALETHAIAIAKLQKQAAAAKAAMDRAVAARTALVDSIDARRDLNAQLTGELEAVQQRLQGAMNQLAGGRSAPVALPIRPFRGALPWPAPGVVVARFGRQRTSRFGTTIARSGIEISMADGRPVKSVHEGTVAYAAPFTGFGNLVIVDHADGAYSLYGYLASLDAARGDRVDSGGAIGTSGRNPSGNPSLYFEMRIDGKPVDPLQWLKR